MVGRGFDGEFVLAAGRGYENVQNHSTPETLAFRDGVTIAAREGWQQINVETDCQVLVSMWKSRKKQRSEIMGILSQIDELILSFQEFDLSY